MQDIALFHAALADESRLRLLCLLKNGDTCVCYLQEVLRASQPKISRHLAYLKKAGLVESRRDGKWKHYRLKPLDPTLRKILALSLKHLERQPQIKGDRRRLKQVNSCPQHYGISPAQKRNGLPNVVQELLLSAVAGLRAF